MKEEKIFFSGGQDLCVWNEKGELLHKCDRASEHCKYIQGAPNEDIVQNHLT